MALWSGHGEIRYDNGSKLSEGLVEMVVHCFVCLIARMSMLLLQNADPRHCP